MALSVTHTGVVGLVLRRSPELMGIEPYFMRVISGIEEALIRSDYSLLLRLVDVDHNGDSEPNLSVFERWAKERWVDGVILFDRRASDSRARLLAELDLPAVLHGTAQPDSTMPFVANSEDSDSTRLLDLLVRHGHSHVAHVLGPDDLLHERLRRDLVAARCRAAGVRLTQVSSDYTWDGGKRTAGALLDRSLPQRPTALILGNDLMALGALEAARRLGIEVPTRLSVAAWEDSIVCRLANPPLTAIDHRPEESGRLSAELLLRLVAEGKAANRRGPGGHLIERASVGPAPATRRSAAGASHARNPDSTSETLIPVSHRFG